MLDLSNIEIGLKSVSSHAVLGAGRNNWTLLIDFVPVAGEKSLELDFISQAYWSSDSFVNILSWG
jgi:hypothetical protein